MPHIYLLKGTFTTKFTAYECGSNEKYVLKISCRLKPVRGGIGTFNFQMTLKQPLNDVWYQADMFFKFGTVYRKWLFSQNIDFCDAINRYPSVDILSKITVSFWKKYISIENCPIGKPINVTFNPDNSSRTVGLEVVPRLPEGDYKIFSRWHTMDNQTILWYETKFNVKSEMGVNRTTMDMG